MWFLGVAPWSLSEDLGTHALDPRVHLHGAGEIAGMEKKKRLKNALDPNQPEDARMENSC